MTEQPSLARRLHKTLGISQPYASQISRGKRDPSLKMALKIFRELGVKLGPLEGKTSPEIKALERAASIMGAQ